jgi:hypothetical protein
MPLGIAAVLGYELYIAVEDIDHARTKTKSPQTNGICERFHRPCSIFLSRGVPQEDPQCRGR